jgi:hypothetical protein
MGISALKRSISARQMPASLGVQGPGDSTIASGAMAAISSSVILSLRTTVVSAPSSPRKWTRL